MFKVGDKVKYVSYCADHGITEANFEWPLTTIFTVSENEFRTDDITAVRLKEVGMYWYMPVSCLQKVIKHEPPKNDIEWLDKVQENFKE